jgi:hypothetical protein
MKANYVSANSIIKGGREFVLNLMRVLARVASLTEYYDENHILAAHALPAARQTRVT